MAQQVAQEVLLEDSLAREGPLANPSCEFFFFPRETFAKCMLGSGLSQKYSFLNV